MSQYQYAVALDQIPRISIAQITMNSPPSAAEQDEDWTQITDLALRRRIQNRIAQRNYRNKLKRRLRELERWAATPEGSPPAPECGTQRQAVRQDMNKSHAKTLGRTAAPKKLPAPRSTTDNGGLSFSPAYNDREESCTPPFTPYWPSLTPDEMYLPTYAYAQTYPTTTMAGGYSGYINTTSALYTPTLMTQFNDIVERQ